MTRNKARKAHWSHNPHKARTQPATTLWHVYWSPEGRRIATVTAEHEHDAIRKAPYPYRNALGELYALPDGIQVPENSEVTGIWADDKDKD